jgi:hypothetical protein
MLNSVFDYALKYFGRLLCTELVLGLVLHPLGFIASVKITELLFFSPCTTAPRGLGASSLSWFHDHTQKHHSW